jgi:hypothetical protein
VSDVHFLAEFKVTCVAITCALEEVLNRPDGVPGAVTARTVIRVLELVSELTQNSSSLEGSFSKSDVFVRAITMLVKLVVSLIDDCLLARFIIADVLVFPAQNRLDRTASRIGLTIDVVLDSIYRANEELLRSVLLLFGWLDLWLSLWALVDLVLVCAHVASPFLVLEFGLCFLRV